MRRAAGWAAMAMLVGCEQARTELVVRVDSELAWGSGQRVQSIVLTVRRGGESGPLRSTRTTPLGAGAGRRSLPLYVGVLAADGDTDTPVWIEALGCSGPNGCAAADAGVAQRAVVRFAQGETQEVPLLLASACVGATCASDQRCATDTGRCEAATRAQGTVRPYAGASDAGPATDARRDGGERIDGGGCVSGACGPSYGWSQRFGLRHTDSSVRAIAVDTTGNVYVAGQGATGTTFGGAPITAPNVAAFVAAFAPDGRPRWFRQIGTDGGVASIAVDTAGNLYLTGNCYAPVDLGGGPLAGAAIDTPGMFLASLAADGTHRWSRRFARTSLRDIAIAGDTLTGVGINGLNVGDGNVDFGGGSSTGERGELYVASFGLDGAHRWTRHFGVNDGDPRIAAMADGTSCIAGSHATPLNFGGDPLTGDGTTQPYVACLTSAGIYRWSHRFESDGNSAYTTDVAVDASGNVAMTGLFERSIDFGGGPRRSTGGYDVFVASFTPTGAHRWSQRLGGSGIDGSTSITTDHRGNLFVTGYFQGSLSFAGEMVASAGARDAFLATFSPAGEPQWFRRYGGTMEDYGFGVDASATRIALTGVFIGEVDFGGGALSSVGNRDVFLISLAR